MASAYSGKITEEFKTIYKELKREGIIKGASLSEPAETNLHSWLQYALVMAGERAGLRGATEIKLKFDPPLDQRKRYKILKRPRRFCRVDVAFYIKNELIGIAEVHTINDANVYLPTEKFVKNNVPFLSDRDVLLHTLRNSESKLNFVILVVTLPRNASRIPWFSDMRKVVTKIANNLQNTKNFYEAFKDGWKEFRDTVAKEVECSLVIIDEDEEAEIV